MKNLEMLEYILEKGYDVNHHKSNGKTALCNSVYRNHVKITELLLKYNADMEIKDKQVNFFFSFWMILFIIKTDADAPLK